MPKLYLMNSPILAVSEDYNEGKVTFDRLDLEEAKDVFNSFVDRGYDVVSAIGHEATARVFSTILGHEVQMNRITVMMEPGDSALCLKLKKRLPEGKVIQDPKELEEIGYDILLINFSEGRKKE